MSNNKHFDNWFLGDLDKKTTDDLFKIEIAIRIIVLITITTLAIFF